MLGATGKSAWLVTATFCVVFSMPDMLCVGVSTPCVLWSALFAGANVHVASKNFFEVTAAGKVALLVITLSTLISLTLLVVNANVEKVCCCFVEDFGRRLVLRFFLLFFLRLFFLFRFRFVWFDFESLLSTFCLFTRMLGKARTSLSSSKASLLTRKSVTLLVGANICKYHKFGGCLRRLRLLAIAVEVFLHHAITSLTRSTFTLLERRRSRRNDTNAEFQIYWHI